MPTNIIAVLGLASVPLLGLWITYCTRRELWLAWGSRKWPTVDGEILDRTSARELASALAPIEPWRRAVKHGESVKVHYYPADPSQAVLQPGLTGDLITSPILTVLGVIGLTWALLS